MALLRHYSLKEVHSLAHIFKVTLHIIYTFYQYDMHYHPMLYIALERNWCRVNELQMKCIKKTQAVHLQKRVQKATKQSRVLTPFTALLIHVGNRKELHKLDAWHQVILQTSPFVVSWFAYFKLDWPLLACSNKM